MTRKIVTCDICGKDITNENIKYKFKKYKSTYGNFDDCEFSKWGRCDMCLDCYFDLLSFVIEKKKQRSDTK